MRVPLSRPGCTRFARNSGSRLEGLIPGAYQPFAQPILTAFAVRPGQVTTASDVAEAVWGAATEVDGPLHHPAGPDAVALAGPA